MLGTYAALANRHKNYLPLVLLIIIGVDFIMFGVWPILWDMLRVIAAYQCWDPPTHTTGEAAAACVELGPKAMPILPGPLRNFRLGSALLRYWGSLDCKMGNEVLRNSGTSWMCYVNGQATLACIPLLRLATEDLRISKLVEEEPWRSLASIFSRADKKLRLRDISDILQLISSWLD